MKHRKMVNILQSDILQVNATFYFPLYPIYKWASFKLNMRNYYDYAIYRVLRKMDFFNGYGFHF